MDESKPPEFSLSALVAEIRSNASTDMEFAQRVALVCAKLADQAAVDWGQGASVAIRRVFRLD